MSGCIVILSSCPLFAEGVASRLSQYLGRMKIEIVDPRRPDPVGRVLAFRPSTVILDVTDLEVVQLCPMHDLLGAQPTLRIIQLDPQHERAQVVTSEHHPAFVVRDLAEIILQPA